MALVAIAIGTSHMPGLNQPVEHWFTRADSDRHYIEAQGLGDYEALSREKAPWIGPEITEQRLRERYEDCQKALVTLVEVLRAADPDAVVIVGDDHREVFSAEHMPSIDIHWAEQIFVPPFAGRRNADGQPPESRESFLYPGAAELAEHLLHRLARGGHSERSA